MALSDPQSVVIGANTRTVAKTIDNPTSTSYQDTDNGVTFTVSSQAKTRRRTAVRVDLEKIAADPFVTTINRKLSSSAYLVIDSPLTGFTKTELKELALAISTWMTAGSSANLLKAIGGEH
jgi:hypothetical protein